MSDHILSQKTYYAIFAALVGLTLLTVGLSFLPLGEWHTPVGLLIASAKVALVALFFMHLLYSSRLIWLVAAAGLFWLAIMIALTLADYLTRSWSSI